MKPIVPVKYLLPIGLLLMSAGFILGHFFKIPDFVDGFLKGIGIAIVFLSLIKNWYVKRADR